MKYLIRCSIFEMMDRNFVVVEIIDSLQWCFEREAMIDAKGSINYPYVGVYVLGY